MLLPESWLRTRVNPEISTEELAHRLTMAGLEVEGVEPVAPATANVVTARIESAEPHPNADRLRVCQVNDGSGHLLQIVCGAPNARAGLVVPLARIGAELPGGMKIGPVKMRGVESSGMLCSARELALSEESAGLLELPADTEIGQDIRRALDLDDHVLELKMTPNRADCLSIMGVAREVAALTQVPLVPLVFESVPVTLDECLQVDVQAPDLCGRFGGRVVRGVNAHAQTPDWMKRRLERAGQRPISALVDISNYVMLELGRPSHIFDLDKIQGGLAVRWARQGETLALLNGQTIELAPDVGIVAAGDVPESLAGIMGGEASSVTLETQSIYIEAAFWHPESIAGRSRRYKFSSEAGHRFERGVDFQSIPEHIDYITRLVIDICGGQAGPITDQQVSLPARPAVGMRLSRCRRLLGIEVSQEEVTGIFDALGLPFVLEGETFLVTPPSFRFDLNIEEDLVEEVIRIYGYERIPERPPMARAQMHMRPESTHGPHALRRVMADLDYQEVVNYSFVEAAWERDLTDNVQPIELLNPIASHMSVMRSSLWGGLLANIRHNANHRQPRVRVFELGRVFRRNADAEDGPLGVQGVDQPLRLAAVAWGPALPEQWAETARKVDFFDIKQDLINLFGTQAEALAFVAQPHPALHPGRSAQILFKGEAIGWLGELHPRWVRQFDLASAPVLFEVAFDALLQARIPSYREVSRQPVVQRDLALWVDEAVTWQSMLDTIAAERLRQPDLGIVRDVRLFDVWREAGAAVEGADKALFKKEKSLAFRFWLQDTDATLDDARVEAALALLRDALVRQHGARQRV